MTQEKIKTIIAQQLGVVESTLTSDTNIVDNLHADSLDLVELVITLENVFRIKIEEREYEGAQTVQQITDLVDSKLKEKL
jgi:acyl carrier protein